LELFTSTADITPTKYLLLPAHHTDAYLKWWRPIPAGVQ
jgi:hypothetical protein